MGRRLGLAVLTGALAMTSGLVAAGPAQALNCSAFKTAVESATNGDVVSLDAGLTCHDAYTLPKTRSAPFAFTIQGAGAGATLDGTTLPDRIMTGTPSSGKVIDLTVKNLTFRNGTSAPGGAALLLIGQVDLTLDGDRFLGNSATNPDSKGGAVLVASSVGTRKVEVRNSAFGSAAEPNTAFEGGALYVNNEDTGPSIELVRDTFDHNQADYDGAVFLSAYKSGNSLRIADSRFIANRAVQQFGGAVVNSRAAVLERNTFARNHVDDLSSSSSNFVVGAGLFVNRSTAVASLTQHDNVFEGNRITAGTETNFGAAGAGEYDAGVPLTSRRDRFTNNSIPAPTGTEESEGAGLVVEGCAVVPGVVPDRLEGDVAAGNKGGAGTHGAGVYAGGCGPGPVDLTILDSTIAGNSTSGAGAASGLFGGADDKLTLRNSIVAGNTGATDLTGFGAGRTVSHSDACGPAVLPGTGNVCANPLLAGAAAGNVHETPSSPTIDAGANAEVAAGLTTDLDGGARILGAAVDMGADEFVDPFTGVVIARKAVTVKKGAARIRVSCPAGVPGPCDGVLSLKKRKGKKRKLGHNAFSIASGHSARVRVRISKSGRRALRKRGSLKVRARAVATDRLGARGVSSVKLKLKKKRKHKRR